jgi:hypothetical protein
MIVDSSVLIAVLTKESDGDSFARIMNEPGVLRISAATYLETSIVIDKHRDPVLSAGFDELLHDLEAIVEPGRFHRQRAKARCSTSATTIPSTTSPTSPRLRARAVPRRQDAMAQILINSRMCAEGHRPICQDTGIVNVFLKVGMDVRFEPLRARHR